MGKWLILYVKIYVILWSRNKILYASSSNVYAQPLKLMKKYTFCEIT